MSFGNAGSHPSTEEQVEVARQIERSRTEPRQTRPLRGRRGGSRGLRGGESGGDRAGFRGGFGRGFHGGVEDTSSAGNQMASTQQIAPTESGPSVDGRGQLASRPSAGQLGLSQSMGPGSPIQVYSAPQALNTSTTPTSSAGASGFGEPMDVDESPTAAVRCGASNMDYEVIERSLLDDDNSSSISQKPLIPSTGRRESIHRRDSGRGSHALKKLGGLRTSRWAK